MPWISVQIMLVLSVMYDLKYWFNISGYFWCFTKIQQIFMHLLITSVKYATCWLQFSGRVWSFANSSSFSVSKWRFLDFENDHFLKQLVFTKKRSCMKWAFKYLSISYVSFMYFDCDMAECDMFWIITFLGNLLSLLAEFVFWNFTAFWL